ncbi:MAG TPA: calcium-binding protein [Allosphingosinicella sp.]|jgi:Ca2+-binding RTX toxin-like protein
MAKIIGTSAGETLVGTSGDDQIEGLGGSDFITAGDGNDEVLGGDDNDALNGDGGNDILDGGLGDDSLNGGLGNDQVSGGDGNDYISGGQGSDTLDGGAGDDEFQINRNFGAAGLTTVFAGSGNDHVYVFGPGALDLDAGEGDDAIELSWPQGTYDLTLGTGSDLVAISGGLPFNNDFAITIADFETGAAGDRIDFSTLLALSLAGWDFNANPFATGHLQLLQAGTDTLLRIDRDGSGGNAWDFSTLITFNNTSAAAFTYGNLDGFPADGSIPAGLALTGTAGNDSLVGAAGDDTIDGLDGMDRLWGGSGDDTITGGADTDYLYGEGGNDELNGGAGTDMLDPGYGTDTVRGGEGNDYITSTSGGDQLLQGEADNDTVSISRNYAETGDIVTAQGGDGDDSFMLYAYGPHHLFKLDGGAGDDSIQIGWLQGTAELTLGTGTDVIKFSDSQNVLLQYGSVIVQDFQTGASGDRLDLDTWLVNALVAWDQQSNPFGTGHLKLVQSGADALLQVDADAGGSASAFRTVVTFKDVQAASFVQENLGGYPADGSEPEGITLIGTGASETLTGTAGADRIEGVGGFDRIDGRGGNDILIGGASFDDIRGGAGNDTIDGGDGGGLLGGDTGDDIIQGGAGIDSIYLGTGADTAHAGANNDSFVFQSSDGTGKTSIGYGEAGNDSFSMRSYTSAVYIADGGEGDDVFEIGGVTGATILTLGAGADRIGIAGDRYSGGSGTLSVTDFAVGTGGDFLDLAGAMSVLATGWDGTANAFATGHLRLTQSGSASIIEIDRDGGSDGNWVPLITLLDTVASSLSTASIGFTPTVVYGTGGDDELIGSARDDYFIGGDGNDRLDGRAGADTMVGGDGDDTYYVDSFADVVTELAGEGTDRVVTALGSATDYTRLYVLPDAVENFTGTSLTRQGVRGNALDNDMVTGAGNDLLVLDDGGNDIVASGGGADFFYFGAAWTAADKVDGGAGFDTVALLGSYNMLLDAGHLTGVERLNLYTGLHEPGGAAASYSITTTDSAVAAGTALNILAGSLRAEETLVFNGSAEKDARFTVTAGAGNDVLAGGAKNDYLAGGAGKDSVYGLFGNDTLYGGLGADMLDGGAGKDFFQYQSAAESTGLNFDTLSRFDASTDRIDLPFTVSGWAGRFTGTLSTASFDSDLAKVLDDALSSHSAAMFQADGGDFAGRIFVVVDGNGDGAYTAGQDYLFELASPVMPLSVPPVFA